MAPKKNPPVKKENNKKPPVVKKVVKITPAEKLRSKSQIIGTIAERTGLGRKEVVSVFEEMSQLIAADIGKKGCGLFTVPGLMKIKKVHKPKRPARMGKNPFTGQEMMFQAKPARDVVKVLPLKSLKEMV